MLKFTSVKVMKGYQKTLIARGIITLGAVNYGAMGRYTSEHLMRFLCNVSSITINYICKKYKLLR